MRSFTKVVTSVRIRFDMSAGSLSGKGASVSLSCVTQKLMLRRSKTHSTFRLEYMSNSLKESSAFCISSCVSAPEAATATARCLSAAIALAAFRAAGESMALGNSCIGVAPTGRYAIDHCLKSRFPLPFNRGVSSSAAASSSLLSLAAR